MQLIAKFLQLYQQTVRLGVRPGLSIELAGRVQLANTLALIQCLLIPVWYALSPPIFAMQATYLVFEAIFISVLAFNHFQLYTVSRITLNVAIVSMFVVLSCMGVRPMDSEIKVIVQMLLLSMILIPYFLFQEEEKLGRRLAFSYFMYCIIALSSIDQWLQWVETPPTTAENMQKVEMVVPIVCLFLVVTLTLMGESMNGKIKQHYLTIEKNKNIELENASVSIRLQSAELLETQEQLLSYKNELEQNQTILEQKAEESQKNNEELKRLIDEMDKSQALLTEQQRLESKLAKTAEMLRWGDQDDRRTWTENLLRKLAKFTNGLKAALYVAEDAETLTLWGTLAGVTNEDVQTRIAFGQGLAGTVAQTRQPFVENHLPAGAAYLTAGLGRLPLSSVCVMPLVYNDALVGVLEINAVQPFDQQDLLFLERAAEGVAANLLAIKNQEQIKILLSEAQSKAEALTAQEEEMRQYVEELEAAQQETRRIQYELQNSQNSLVSVLNSVDDRILALDQNYNLILFNDVVKKIIEDGFKVELKIGDNIFNYVFEDQREKRKASYDRALAGEQFTEEQHITGQGYEVFLETTYNPMRNVQGQVVGISVFSRDITGRKKNEELIRKSEQRLKFQFEQLPLGIIEWTHDFDVQAWNPAAEKIFHYTKEEAMGKNVLDLVVLPELRDASMPVLRALMQKRNNARRIFQNRTADGRVITCEWFNTPLLNEKNEVVALMSIVQDITERNAAEEALKQSEANLKIAQKLARLGSWELNLSDGRLVWSEEMFNLFGLKDQKTTPTLNGLWALIHPQDVEAMQANFRNCMQNGQPFQTDHRVVTATGQTIFLQTRAEAQTNEDGKPVKITGTCTDMTKIKQAENSLLQKNKQLTASENKMRQSLDELQEAQEENQKIQRELKKSQEKLLSVNENLEKIIEERSAELKRAMQELKTAASQMRSMIDQFPISIQIFDINGAIQDGNRAMEEIWHAGIDVLKAQNYNLLQDPQFETMGLAMEIERAFRGEAVELPVSEYIVQWKEGSELIEFKWMKIGLFPVKDENGQILNVAAYHQDYTELKEAETNLKNLTAFQEAILNSASFGVVSTDMDRTIVGFNQQAERMLGYAANEVLQMAQPHLFILEDEYEARKKEFAALFVEAAHRSNETGQPEETEWTFCRRDGSRFPVKMTVAGARNANNELIGYVAVVADVSEQKRAEQEIKNSERRFRGVIEQFPMGLQLFNAQGGSTLVNSSLAKMLHFDANAETEYNVFDDEFLHQNNVTPLLAQALQGQCAEAPPLNYTLDNENRWIRLYAFPIANENNRVNEFGLVYEDITQALQTQQEIQESEKRFRQANEELTAALNEQESLRQNMIDAEKMATLGQLFAGIAHEINNPVGAVKSSAETALSIYPRLLAEYPELLEKTRSQQELLFNFISKILTNQTVLASREERKLRRALAEKLAPFGLEDPESSARQLVEAGWTNEDIEAFFPLFQCLDLGRLIDVLYRIGQIKISLSNIETATEKIQKIMVALKKYSHGHTDDEPIPTDLAENIDSILTLYTHSLKNTIELETNYQTRQTVPAFPDELGQVWTNLISNSLHAMGFSGSIKIDVWDEGDHVAVKFTDSGSGIPPEKLAHIFDAFYTTKKRGEGTGLGLHLCKKIIEKHRGTMTVDSEPGRTTFTITLPKF